MKKLLYLLAFACIAFLVSISFDAIVMSSFWISPNPQYSFTMSGATASDIFIMGMPDEELVFTEVEGILYSGTNVVGTIQKCDSEGLNCSNVIANMTFDGGRDTFPTPATPFTSTTITANQTLKWVTVSSSSPGYLTVSLRYFPSGS